MCGTLILTHEDLYKQRKLNKKTISYVTFYFFLKEDVFFSLITYRKKKSCDGSIIGTGNHATSQPPSHEHTAQNKDRCYPIVMDT